MRLAYVDSSVILRSLLREPLPELDFTGFERLFTSEITEMECRRVLDRIRIQERIPDEEFAQRYLELYDQLQALNVIRISSHILRRACESFPVVVRTLDSIHLSSLILAQTKLGQDSTWTFVTHDKQLKIAAQALGFETQISE